MYGICYNIPICSYCIDGFFTVNHLVNDKNKICAPKPSAAQGYVVDSAVYTTGAPCLCNTFISSGFDSHVISKKKKKKIGCLTSQRDLDSSSCDMRATSMLVCQLLQKKTMRPNVSLTDFTEHFLCFINTLLLWWMILVISSLTWTAFFQGINSPRH